MWRIVRGLLLGAVAGLVLGVVARALMRLVAVGMVVAPEFHLGPTIAVVALFVLAGAGAGAARALAGDAWLRVLVLALSAAPLLVVGAAFAVGEVGEILDRDLTPPWKAELLLLSAMIAGIVLVTPCAGWLTARRWTTPRWTGTPVTSRRSLSR